MSKPLALDRIGRILGTKFLFQNITLDSLRNREESTFVGNRSFLFCHSKTWAKDRNPWKMGRADELWNSHFLVKK